MDLVLPIRIDDCDLLCKSLRKVVHCYRILFAMRPIRASNRREVLFLVLKFLFGSRLKRGAKSFLLHFLLLFKIDCQFPGIDTESVVRGFNSVDGGNAHRWEVVSEVDRAVPTPSMCSQKGSFVLFWVASWLWWDAHRWESLLWADSEKEVVLVGSEDLGLRLTVSLQCRIAELDLHFYLH